MACGSHIHMLTGQIIRVTPHIAYHSGRGAIDPHFYLLALYPMHFPSKDPPEPDCRFQPAACGCLNEMSWQ